MTEWIDQFVASLREELQQYGEMLARLDEQQEWIAKRASDALIESVGYVERQVQILQQARTARETIMRQIIGYLELPKDCGLGALLAHFPLHYRPLIEALVDENTQLLVRVQQRTRQNHLLLMHSLEAMQRLIKSMFPERSSTVYSLNGRTPQSGSSTVLFEAVS